MGLCWQFLQGLGAPGSIMSLKCFLWVFKAIDSYGDLILDKRFKQTGLRQAQLIEQHRKILSHSSANHPALEVQTTHTPQRIIQA